MKMVETKKDWELEYERFWGIIQKPLPEGKVCKVKNLYFGKEKHPYINCEEKATPMEKLHDLLEMEDQNGQEIPILQDQLIRLKDDLKQETSRIREGELGEPERYLRLLSLIKSNTEAIETREDFAFSIKYQMKKVTLGE